MSTVKHHFNFDGKAIQSFDDAYLQYKQINLTQNMRYHAINARLTPLKK